MIKILGYKEKIFPLKEKVPYYWNNFKDTLKKTSIEVILLASLGGFIGGISSYNHEDDKDKVVPLSFSEVEQIEIDARQMGVSVPPMTRYLAYTNDLSMKVFECWNTSHEKIIFGNNTRTFANELEMRIDPTFKIYKYEIADFTKTLPNYADSALESIKPLLSTRESLPEIINEFKKSYDHEHEEHGHYEPRITFTSDGKGNIQTHVHLEYVYDYTIHWFNYFKEHGNLASKKLDKTIKDNPNFGFREKLM